MGLLHQNGFSNLLTADGLVYQGWTNVSSEGFAISSTSKAPASGPSGTINKSLRIAGDTSATNHRAYLPTNSIHDTLICQFHVYVDHPRAFYDAYPFLTFMSGTNVKISVSLGTYESNAGKVNVRNSAGTSLGQSVAQIAEDTWYYISVKVKFHPTAGSIEVKINNVSEVYVSNINTAPDGASYCDRLRFSAQGDYHACYYYLSNLILCDGDGDINNDFFNGVVWLLTKPASADTSVADWLPLSGLSGYAMVDDTTPDGDTTYIYSPDNTVGDESRFAFGSFSGVTNARYVGFRVSATCRVDTGVVGTKITAEYDGDVAESSESINGLSYTTRVLQMQTAPDGVTRLSDVVVNNLTGGVKVSSSS